MKLSELQTHEDVLAEELRDPDFRAEWDRLALSRAVGQCVLRYRTRHALTQRQLAAILGMRQPQVARLEAGSHDPSFATLQLLADRLDMELLVDISPSRSRTRWVRSRPRDAAQYEEAELASGTRVAVAAR